MHYLRLRFTDASLVVNNKASRPMKGYTHVYNEVGVYSPSDATREVDYETPIGTSQISNMLHVMFGYAPKPSYRGSLIKRVEEIYEMAKTARIFYYDGCNKDMYEKSELFQGAKAPFNSHATRTTKIGDKLYDGVYNWQFFLRRFKGYDKKYLTDILSLFNDVLGCEDVTREYTFKDFVLSFEPHTKDEDVVEFIISNPIYFKKILLSKMFYVIFKTTMKIDKKSGAVTLGYEMPSGNNTSYNQPTPLFETNDVSKRKAKLSGEIIIEIEDDKWIDILHNFGMLPTLMEGGVVTIMSLGEELPISEAKYELEFKEISEQKGLKDVVSQ